MKTKFEISAGGVVYKSEKGEIRVVLINPRGEIWCLPKGLVEKGESLEEAARREVREETGVKGTIVEKIDKKDIWFFWEEEGKKVRHHKIIYFFLLKYQEGKTENHDKEVKDARWIEIEEAIRLASYRNEKEILTKAYEIIKKREGQS